MPFILVEVLLFLNILFAALVRLPFQKRLAGFYVTHLGLLMIILGAALTSHYGLDARLELVPGETSSTVLVDEPQLYVRWTATNGALGAIALPLPRTAIDLDPELTANAGDILLRVERYIPYAVAKINQNEWNYDFPTSDAPLRSKAALVTLSRRDRPQEVHRMWVSDTSMTTKKFGDDELIEMAVGPRIERLPFTFGLENFRMDTDPGSLEPSAFTSRVNVTSGTNHESLDVTMNRPFKRDGFTIYQTSYFPTENGTTGSIFTVNRDPGRPMKYAGSLFLVGGSILHFALRIARKRKEVRDETVSPVYSRHLKSDQFDPSVVRV
jgi:hypothetical protein